MKVVGIVGHEAAKFTRETESLARIAIRHVIEGADMVVSGRCHLGGIDIWAIEEAKAMGIATHEYPPKTLSWADGYKPRNILIARVATEVYSIVVRELPAHYTGMRFDLCYHCGTNEHVKSGGCWTTKYARTKFGKIGRTIVI